MRIEDHEFHLHYATNMNEIKQKVKSQGKCGDGVMVVQWMLWTENLGHIYIGFQFWLGWTDDTELYIFLFMVGW